MTLATVAAVDRAKARLRSATDAATAKYPGAQDARLLEAIDTLPNLTATTRLAPEAREMIRVALSIEGLTLDDLRELQPPRRTK